MQETIYSECSKFTVSEFQRNRVGFQNTILSSLRTKLSEEFFAEVKDVQVRIFAIV